MFGLGGEVNKATLTAAAVAVWCGISFGIFKQAKILASSLSEHTHTHKHEYTVCLMSLFQLFLSLYLSLSFAYTRCLFLTASFHIVRRIFSDMFFLAFSYVFLCKCVCMRVFVYFVKKRTE